jgi:hypothetical protein
MNYKFIIITCLTFLAVGYSELIMAEQPTPTQPDITNSNIETTAKDTELLNTLAKLEKDSWEAIKKRDTDFFRTYMAPEFKAILVDGSTANQADFIRNLDDFQLTHYTMGKVSLLRISHDVVMILYKINYEGFQQGKKINESNIESTSVYVLRNDKWLEFFYQETQSPKL